MKTKIASIELEPFLYKTHNDIPRDNRLQLAELMNRRLASAIDLQMQMKQAHWNVKGPNLIGLHKLFDKVAESVESYVYLIAERIVQIGGIAEGTVRVAANRPQLGEYPLTNSEGSSHVDEVSVALGTFGKEARLTIDEANGLDDADTADLFTEVSRGIDKWLWFIKAYSQPKA